MRNKSYVIGGLIIVIVSGLFVFFGRSPDFVEPKTIVTLQEQSEPPVTDKELKSSYPRGAIRMPSGSIASITSSDLKTLRDSYPDQHVVKAETGKSPHKTPDSLIKFAKAMGPLMEKAYKSGDDAKMLINELHDCAVDESVAQTARALCVSNAEKLAKTHPQMKDKATEIRAHVSPDVMKLLDKKNVLLKK